MAEQYPLVGRVVVVPVVHRMSGRFARVVDRQHLRRDKYAVVAVGDGLYAKHAYHNRECAHHYLLQRSIPSCFKKLRSPSASRHSSPGLFVAEMIDLVEKKFCLIRIDATGLNNRMSTRRPVLSAARAGSR